MLSVDCRYIKGNSRTIRLCRVDSLPWRMPNNVQIYPHKGTHRFRMPRSHSDVNPPLQFLTLYHKHSEDILDQVITRDKIWVHNYTPPSKQASKYWMKKGECPRVKAKTGKSVNKHMVTVFWDRKGVVPTLYAPWGTTINAHAYCQVLQDLYMAIWRKWSWWQSKLLFSRNFLFFGWQWDFLEELWPKFKQSKDWIIR